MLKRILFTFIICVTIFVGISVNGYAFSKGSSDTNYLPNRVVRYTWDVKYKESILTGYADIETQYSPKGNKFVRLVNCGYVEDKGQEYSFEAGNVGFNCTAYSCNVYYTGTWKNNSTGLSDALLKTYSFTFYPEPVQ